MLVRRFGSACAAVALALACSAAAEPTPPSPTTTVSPAVVTGQTPAPAQTTAVAPPAPDPVICKHTAALTGSRLGGGQICLRRSQWDDNNRAARDILENSVRGGDQTNCTPALAGNC